MKPDILIKWSNKEECLEVHWKEGYESMALNLLTYFNSAVMHFNFEKRLPEFDPPMTEQLEKKGFDITTFKFEIYKQTPF